MHLSLSYPPVTWLVGSTQVCMYYSINFPQSLNQPHTQENTQENRRILLLKTEYNTQENRRILLLKTEYNEGSLYHFPKGPHSTFGLTLIFVGLPTTDSMLPAYTFASLQDAVHSVSSQKLHRKNKNCTMVVNPGAHTLCWKNKNSFK